MKRIVIFVIAIIATLQAGNVYSEEPEPEKEPRYGSSLYRPDALVSILSELKLKGIYPGKTLWLRYPLGGLPGLAEVKVVDITLADKHDYYGNHRCIVLKIGYGGHEITKLDDFHYIDEVFNCFYQKNAAAKWNKRVINAIKKGEINIGMTANQVVATWGRPSKINETEYGKHTHEQWIMNMSDNTYLYFDNGILTAIQSSR